MKNQIKPVFTKSIFDFENVVDNNNKSLELFEKFTMTGDERSRTIYAGIIVDYYLDRILKLLFVNFKALTERPDFTFSFKISLLKSLRIIPDNIITMCDCIREVRNDFAHNLDIDNINDIKLKTRQKIHQLYIENSSKVLDIKLIKKFEIIYRLGSSDLRAYEQNIRLLRAKIDDPNFEIELQNLNERSMFEMHERLIKEGPIKVIDRGDEIEEIYPKALSVIKRKNNNKNNR